jgi:hypothetical protein
MQQQFFSPPSNKTVEINETLEIIRKENKSLPSSVRLCSESFFRKF